MSDIRAGIIQQSSARGGEKSDTKVNTENRSEVQGAKQSKNLQ